MESKIAVKEPNNELITNYFRDASLLILYKVLMH